MEEKNLWLNTRGSFGIVLEGGKFVTTQHNWEERIHWEKKALLRFSFDLQIFELIAQKHPFKDVSK